MEKRTRIEYLDNLRFTAMLGILCVHITGVVASSVVSPGTLTWELVSFLRNLCYCGPALFLMISGYLLLSGEKTANVQVLFRKRLPKLVIPLIAWTVVAAAWIGHLADDYSIEGVLARSLHGVYEPIMTHFWFMFSLAAIYLLSPLLYSGMKAADRDVKRMLLILILIVNLRYVLSCILPEKIDRFLSFDILNKLQPLGGALGCFLLGWYLGNMKKSFSWGILFATGMLFLLLIHLGARSFRLLTGETESAFTNPTTGLEVGLAACIFLLFRQNAARRWKLLEALPVVPLCYPIYYLHVITMELIFGLGWTPHSFLGTLGFTLLNFLLCYLLCKTAVSIRPICYLCSGMPFPEACRSCNWQYTIKRIREKESA